MAPTYRSEDLFKVRDRMRGSNEIVRRMNQSESAVQDHVLRTSSSNVSAPTRIKNHSSFTEATYYEPYERIQPDDFVYHGQRLKNSVRRSRNSPSASIKRGKAEKLLKEHGSPPGVRVTAGGRIVPQDLQQLSSPQQTSVAFDQQPEYHAALRSSHHRLAQCLGVYDQLPHWQPTHLSGTCFHPLGAMNENILPNRSIPGCAVENSSSVSYTVDYQNPSDTWNASKDISRIQVEVQLNGATEEFRAVEKELRILDRSEVMNRVNLTKMQEEANTRHRIVLTNRLDAIRKTINGHKKVLAQILENYQSSDTTVKIDPSTKQHGMDVQPSASQVLPTIASTQGYYMPTVIPFLPQMLPNHQIGYGQSLSPSSTELQHNMGSYGHIPPHPVYSEATPISQAQVRSFNPLKATEARNSNTSQEHETAFSAADNHQGKPVGNLLEHRSDQLGCAPRRSHALEIKRPFDATAETSSSLDPESPVYKPLTTGSNRETPGNQDSARLITADPNTSRPQLQHLDTNSKSYLCQNAGTIQSDRSGTSSVSTTDFFPNDPGSYSLKKFRSYKYKTSATLPGWMSLPCDSNRKDGSPTLNESDGNETRFNGHSVEKSLAAPECNIGKTIVRETIDTMTEPRNPPEERVIDTSLFSGTKQVLVDNNTTMCSDLGNDPPHGLTTAEMHTRLSTRAGEPSPLGSKYAHGHKCGLLQQVLGTESHDPEFYRGYRDGLLNSARAALISGNLVNPDVNDPCNQVSKTAVGDLFLPVSRTSSLPSFDIPAAPFNSTSNTPVKPEPVDSHVILSGNCGTEQKPYTGFIGDQRDTPKKPQLTTATVTIGLPSPLSARKASNQNSGVLISPFHSTHITNLNDHCSPSKAKASTAASPSQAQIQAHTQLDGDGDDKGEHALLGSTSSHRPCLSPTARAVKAASSPTKSFALTSFTQFAFRNKKDNKPECSLMDSTTSKNPTSPTKRRLSFAFGSPKKRKNSNN